MKNEYRVISTQCDEEEFIVCKNGEYFTTVSVYHYKEKGHEDQWVTLENHLNSLKESSWRKFSECLTLEDFFNQY
jgi:hypothetical protein